MNNENKVRVLKTPRVRRRPKTAKVDKNSEINLLAPLSQLTQHMHHVPIKDIEAWVNRSADVRHREAAQKNGKIARPMNSFIMYRSAYAERVKEWCSQNNHQFVSCIAGASWPMEPPEIREKYELLALVERDNHQKAHPQYKFAPNKTQTPPRKKRAINDNNGSDVDDAGYRLGSTASPNPHKLVKMKSESRESTPYDQEPLCPESIHARWPMPIGRALPSLFVAPHEQQHQGAYYMNTHGSFPNMNRSSDDSHAAARPTGYVINNGYSASSSLASIPGSINQELLRPYGSNSSAASTSTANSGNHNHSNGTAVTRMDDSQLDPQLLTSHQAGLDMRSYNHVNLSTIWPQPGQDLGTYMPMSAPMVNNGGSYDPLNTSYTMQPLEEGQQVWARGEDEGIGGSEVVGKDFDQWIHHQNHQPGYGGPQW